MGDPTHHVPMDAIRSADDDLDDEGNDDWMADRSGVVPDADIVIPEADEETEEEAVDDGAEEEE